MHCGAIRASLYKLPLKAHFIACNEMNPTPATKQDASSKLDDASLVSRLLFIAIQEVRENTLFTFEIRYCRFGWSMLIPNGNTSF